LVGQKPALDPSYGWVIPFVTGHKYKVHWGVTGLDFTSMAFTQSQHWTEQDKPIYLFHNFTDVRAEIKFTVRRDVWN